MYVFDLDEAGEFADWVRSIIEKLDSADADGYSQWIWTDAWEQAKVNAERFKHTFPDCPSKFDYNWHPDSPEMKELRAELRKHLEVLLGLPGETVTEDKPKWNAKRGELSFKGSVLITLAARATRMRPILDAFEKAGWEGQVDNPLANHPDDQALGHAVQDLNNRLDLVGGLKFRRDGRHGVVWSQVPLKAP